MKTLLLIGAGSFIGGVCRYLVQQALQANPSSTFPYGTLIVNISGCFLIGLIFALVLKNNLADDWRLFLATGLCGGYTTFSAFSMETIALMRSGDVTSGLVYVATSIVLGLLATFLGLSLVKFI